MPRFPVAGAKPATGLGLVVAVLLHEHCTHESQVPSHGAVSVDAKG